MPVPESPKPAIPPQPQPSAPPKPASYLAASPWSTTDADDIEHPPPAR